MIRHTIWTFGVLTALLGGASVARADVFVRVPFVRVEVGGPGVYVRAPFVNIWVPSSRPVYQVVPGAVTPMPPAQLLHPPKAVPETGEPQPLATNHPTLQEFAKSFQPRGGNFEVTVLSPVTKQPTAVRFNLPEGTPRRVQVNARDIEFIYGVRRFVRIEFDDDGAQVIAR